MIEVFRTPDDRFLDLPGYPFQPRYEDLDGLRMHYLDEGPPDAPPVILFHGEPTWSYLYRTMIPILAQRTRVVAPDLFGFGRSDKPTDRGWYSYVRHVQSMEQLLADRLDVRDATLVVQDWGGPIGLRFAVLHPDRVARLVVLNTGLSFPSEKWPTSTFLRWRDFAERTGLELPIAVVIQSATATEVPPEVIAAYEAPFPTPESKTGAAMFPLLVPIHQGDPGVEEMLETREALARWDKPALVYFSDSDPIFSKRVAESMARLIPTAGEPEFLEGASHFLQEDAGPNVARRIVRFLDAAAR
jgi:haloalkane dehalogenase